MFQQHPDPDVQAALIKLCDALCTWERATGRESALVVREAGFRFRALSGKPIADRDPVSDVDVLRMVPD